MIIMHFKKLIPLVTMLWLMGCDVSATSDAETSQCPKGADSVDVDGELYCAYSSALVIENGFDCPPDQSLLKPLGPVGICGPKGEDRKLPELYKEHREQYPAKWGVESCLTNKSCEQDEICRDSFCRKATRPKSCTSGESEIASAGDCIVPDGICYELENGKWCTKHAINTCPDNMVPSRDSCAEGDLACFSAGKASSCQWTSCPPRGKAIANQAACSPDGSCFELQNGTWCEDLVSQSSACPPDSQVRPNACPTTGPAQGCFPFGNVSCDMLKCPPHYKVLSSDSECVENLPCYTLVNGLVCGVTEFQKCPGNHKEIESIDLCSSGKTCFELGKGGRVCEPL